MYLPKELAAEIEDLCNSLQFYLWLDLSRSLGLWLMFRTEPLMSLNFAPSPWYTPWLIWLMIVFPVVPIRNFLAGKNWQADQGVFSFLSAPLLLIPHRHLLPGISSGSHHPEPSLPGHSEFVAAQSSLFPLKPSGPAVYFFRVTTSLSSKVKTLWKK